MINEFVYKYKLVYIRRNRILTKLRAFETFYTGTAGCRFSLESLHNIINKAAGALNDPSGPVLQILLAVLFSTSDFNTEVLKMFFFPYFFLSFLVLFKRTNFSLFKFDIHTYFLFSGLTNGFEMTVEISYRAFFLTIIKYTRLSSFQGDDSEKNI